MVKSSALPGIQRLRAAATLADAATNQPASHEHVVVNSQDREDTATTMRRTTPTGFEHHTSEQDDMPDAVTSFTPPDTKPQAADMGRMAQTATNHCKTDTATRPDTASAAHAGQLTRTVAGGMSGVPPNVTKTLHGHHIAKGCLVRVHNLLQRPDHGRLESQARTQLSLSEVANFLLQARGQAAPCRQRIRWRRAAIPMTVCFCLATLKIMQLLGMRMTLRGPRLVTTSTCEALMMKATAVRSSIPAAASSVTRMPQMVSARAASTIAMQADMVSYVAFAVMTAPWRLRCACVQCAGCCIARAVTVVSLLGMRFQQC